MALQLGNRVRVAVTSTGTGTLSLGSAVTGMTDFSGLTSGSTVYYTIEDATGAWEVGQGTYTSGAPSTLSRDTVESSSNAGALVSLTAGAQVYVTPAASYLKNIDLLGAMMFGTGADGSATISGAVTLTRDMHYTNLAFTSSGTLSTNGFRVFVSGTLDLSNAPATAILSFGINTAANAGAGTTGGAAVPYAQTSMLIWTLPGMAGLPGANGTATGTPTATTGITMGEALCLGGFGGNGGAGGTGSLGTSGLTGSVNPNTSQSTTYQISTPLPFGRIGYVANYTTYSPGYGQRNGAPITLLSSGSGSGGGGGGGDGTNAGGGGGGSGGSPHGLEIYARVLNRGASTTAGAISAKGRDGGAGGSPTVGNCGGGGGGGGAGGGHLILVCGALTGSAVTNLIDVSGGMGGNGGNGFGTGLGGTGGTGGRTGRYEVWVLSTNTYLTGGVQVAGTAGSTNGGTISGGAGGAGATRRLTL